MNQKVKKHHDNLERVVFNVTKWVGTPYSIILHSLGFVGIFALNFFGVSIDKILLILTTAVSLEAIYLSIFIQMTVNKQVQALEDVEEDIEDLQEDVEEISDDIDKIQAVGGMDRLKKLLTLDPLRKRGLI